jgi:transforming growth factor-beta-induced protein
MKKTILNLVSNRIARIGVLSLAILFVAASCTEKEEMLPETQEFDSMMSITETLENYSEEIEFTEKGDGEFKSFRKYRKVPTFRTLVVALVKTRLIGTVARERLTVLAPTDAAFRELGITPWNVGQVDNLKEILLYHVFGEEVYSYDLMPGFAETLNGASVNVSLDGGVFFNDAEVKKADVRALNGVIHIIDKVLLPPAMDIVDKAISFNPGEFNTLVQAVVAAELVDVLKSDGPFTVFAPTDEAFAKLGVDLSTLSKEDLTKILLYHVVPGKVFSTDLSNSFVKTAGGLYVEVNTDNGAMINSSKVIIPDVQTTNGVIHAIDEVLLPPDMDIVEKAISFNPSEFNTLVNAVVTAGLVETLKSDGPFTVFAPTDQAFADLGVDLSTLSKEDLTKILLYHVVPGTFFSSDLENGNVATVLGQTVSISLNGGVFINDSQVVIPNVQTTNGVIHVINKVLMPQ